MDSIKKALKIFVFLLIALPLLGFLALGKLLFKQGNVSKDNLFVSKAEADTPSCGGGNCGGGEGGNCGCGSAGASVGNCTSSSNCGVSDGSPGDGGGADGGAGCFKAGTLVATGIIADLEFSYKNIEDLEVGDDVIGVVFDADKPVLKKSKVTKLYRHEPDARLFMKLSTDRGANVVATENHRFIVDGQNNGFVMREIKKSQPVVSAFSAPKWDKVSTVESLAKENVAVYNFETETSNYLVSQDKKGWLLVHNYK